MEIDALEDCESSTSYSFLLAVKPFGKNRSEFCLLSCNTSNKPPAKIKYIKMADSRSAPLFSVSPFRKPTQFPRVSSGKRRTKFLYRSYNLVPRVFLVVARELRKTLVKYDEISKILGDLSHAQ